MEQVIAGNGVALADDENTTEQYTVDCIIYDADIARLHVRIGVVHDDAVVAIRVAFGRFFVEACIAAHFAIMKAVEIETLAINFFKTVVAVDRLVHVARGIHSHGKGLGFQIHFFSRIANHATAIVLHADFGCMPHLNRVACKHHKFIARNAAAGVAGRTVQRVRPDAVAANVGDAAVENFKIRRTFFEQNAAGGIIALARIESAAFGNLDIVNFYGVASVDQNGKSGNRSGFNAVDFETRDALGEDPVILREPRKHCF